MIQGCQCLLVALTKCKNKHSERWCSYAALRACVSEEYNDLKRCIMGHMNYSLQEILINTKALKLIDIKYFTVNKVMNTLVLNVNI